MRIITITTYEFVYRNNLSVCQACCYHQGPVIVIALSRKVESNERNVMLSHISISVADRAPPRFTWEKEVGRIISRIVIML